MAAVTGMGRADRPASRAEAELYERHSDRVFGFCLSRLGRREDAEDATQLTFLHAVRGLRRGVVPAAESAWLFGIARNVCLSRWASAGRRRRVEATCDPTELERLAPAHDPRREELIGLESALERLPEQQRRAVLLRDWRGLPYEEIADRLGVSHAAVETLIFRGRAALAEQLGGRATGPRRRARALGGLWSLLDAIKGAFGSAAAGAKLAVAVGATVAVSSGGIALGTTLTREPDAGPVASHREEARPAAPQPAAAGGVTTAPPAHGESLGAGRSGESRDQAPPASGHASSEDTLAATGGPGHAPASDGPDAAQPPAAAAAAAKVEGVRPDALSAHVPTLAPVASPPTDEVVAATEPVVAVVEETLDSTDLPVLPAVEVPKVEVPNVEAPNVEAPNAGTVPEPPAAPALPAAPAVPSLP